MSATFSTGSLAHHGGLEGDLQAGVVTTQALPQPAVHRGVQRYALKGFIGCNAEEYNRFYQTAYGP
jgi:hypothetical protein